MTLCWYINAIIAQKKTILRTLTFRARTTLNRLTLNNCQRRWERTLCFSLEISEHFGGHTESSRYEIFDKYTFVCCQKHLFVFSVKVVTFSRWCIIATYFDAKLYVRKLSLCNDCRKSVCYYYSSRHVPKTLPFGTCSTESNILIKVIINFIFSSLYWNT